MNRKITLLFLASLICCILAPASFGDGLAANSSPPSPQQMVAQEEYPIFYTSRFDPIKEDYGWWVHFSFTAYTTDITREDAVTVTVLINNEDLIWSGMAAHFDEEYVYARIKQTSIEVDGITMSVNATCVDFLGRSKSIYQDNVTFDVYAPRVEKLIVADTWEARETVLDENNMINLDWQQPVRIQYEFLDAHFNHVEFLTRDSLDVAFEKYGTDQTDALGNFEIIKTWIPLGTWEKIWYLNVVAFDDAGNFNENEFILFFSVPEDQRPIYNEEDLQGAAEEGMKEGRKDLWWSLLAIPFFAGILVAFLLFGAIIARKANYCPVIKKGIVDEMKILD